MSGTYTHGLVQLPTMFVCTRIKYYSRNRFFLFIFSVLYAVLKSIKLLREETRQRVGKPMIIHRLLQNLPTDVGKEANVS